MHATSFRIRRWPQSPLQLRGRPKLRPGSPARPTRDSAERTGPGRRAMVLLMFCAALIGNTASAEDWYRLRGPRQDGKSTETGLLDSWPYEGPPLAWRSKGLGEGHGSVVISKGKVFVQGTYGNSSILFCLDEATGKALWAKRLGPKFLDRTGNGDGPGSTPTIDGDRVYALTSSGHFSCRNVEDGSLVWGMNWPSRFGTKVGRWGATESPVVESDLVIFSPGGKRGTIAAADKFSGKVVWTSTGLNDRPSYASGIVRTIGERRVFMTFTAWAGVGVDCADGKLLWRYQEPANDTANASMPVFHDNKVFYASSYGVGGGLLDVTPRNGRPAARQIYFSREILSHYGGMILHEGHLYGTSGSALVCMDFETGELKWKARSVGKGGITYADGQLYLLGERRLMAIVKATPDGYSENRFEVEDRGWPTRAYPVVSNGRLYIRNQHVLDAHDIRK